MDSENTLNFDIEGSNIENLRHLLAHRAWTEFFVPTLKQSRDAAIAQLLDPSVERKQDYPDDFLRGQISMLEWLLTHPQTLLQEQDAKNAKDQEESEVQDRLGIRAHEGHGPLSHP